MHFFNKGGDFVAIKLKRSEDSEPEIYGNENFGIPKDCSKKQKFSTLKLFFYIVVVAGICVTGYKYYNDTVDYFLPEITFDKTNQPLIYNTSSGIILKTQGGKNYEIGTCADECEISSAVSPTSFGKSVFFLSHGENEEDGLELCYYNLNSGKTSVIDKNVSDFKINANGKYVVYKKGTDLYFSNLEKRHLVFENVCEYYISDNSQAIIFFTQNGTNMYYCGTSKEAEPVLVDSEITKLISPKNNHSNVYYIKNNGLYSRQYGNEAILISENVTDALMLGKTVYYTISESYERPIDDFFSDEKSEEDTDLLMPNGTDFIREVNGLSFFDEELFTKATEEYEQKLMRDEIREYFAETPIKTEGCSLYAFIDGDSNLVDTHLSTPYLSYNSCKNIVVYKKYDTNLEDKKDLSDISSVEEALDNIESIIESPLDIDMYIVKERKNPFIAFEEIITSQIEISLNGRYLYCIQNDQKDGKTLLVRYEIGTSSLKNKTKICENVTDFALDGSDSTAVIVFNNNEISFFCENKLLSLSENSCHDFFFVDGTLFFYDDYDYLTKTGTLCSLRNGRVTVIDTNVHDFRVRRYDAVSYIRNYNPEYKTGTLYLKEGKSIKRLDNRAIAIIN